MDLTGMRRTLDEYDKYKDVKTLSRLFPTNYTEENVISPAPMNVVMVAKELDGGLRSKRPEDTQYLIDISCSRQDVTPEIVKILVKHKMDKKYIARKLSHNLSVTFDHVQPLYDMVSRDSSLIWEFIGKAHTDMGIVRTIVRELNEDRSAASLKRDVFERLVKMDGAEYYSMIPVDISDHDEWISMYEELNPYVLWPYWKDIVTIKKRHDILRMFGTRYLDKSIRGLLIHLYEKLCYASSESITIVDLLYCIAELSIKISETSLVRIAKDAIDLIEQRRIPEADKKIDALLDELEQLNDGTEQ